MNCKKTQDSTWLRKKFKSFQLRMGTLQGALCDAKRVGRRKESKGRKTAHYSSASTNHLTFVSCRTWPLNYGDVACKAVVAIVSPCWPESTQVDPS